VTEIEMLKMNEIKSGSASQSAENGRLYIEGLLEKYPSITEGERLEILDFLSKASALDAALLTCNHAISEKLNAFKHDNRQQLGFTLRSWVVFAIMMSLIALAVYYMWDAGT
jgi:hypothetical protein